MDWGDTGERLFVHVRVEARRHLLDLGPCLNLAVVGQDVDVTGSSSRRGSSYARDSSPEVFAWGLLPTQDGSTRRSRASSVGPSLAEVLREVI